MFDFFINIETYKKELERLSILEVQLNTEMEN